SAPAAARTIGVGPGQEFDRPSRAIAAAQPGDTVSIQPGTYYDCAVWATDDLVVEGAGPGAVLSDKVCEGKALLVIRGSGAVIRNLTLTRARVADNNGAGIRLEGESIVLERVQFLDNQVGLLSSMGASGDIVVRGCRFDGGGIGGDQPSVALSVGAVALLRVEQSVFTGVRGTQVGTAALATELVGNQIATSRLAVSAAGASLLMEDNVLDLTPNAEGRQAAVLANGDARAVLRRNRLVNQTGRPAVLLLDWTTETPVLADNIIGPGDREVTSEGVWRHRSATAFRAAKDGVRSLLGAVKRMIVGP
ncbi:MAG: hypothetical protein H7Z10_13555, partial [Gemmatimonadaceae bacterium]|nr:hypothetical protein [Acetobacteraceae bacterium]